MTETPETPERPDADADADATEAPAEAPEATPSPEAAKAIPSPEAAKATPSPEAAIRESAPTADEPADEEEQEPEVADEAPAKPSRRVRRRRRGGAEASEPAKPVEPAKPAAAPARRKPRRDPSLPIPVVRAQARYVRSSARKARLVCDNIRGKSVEDARAILAHTPRAIALDWSKLLESAVANAEHNHELVGEDLYIKAVMADEGPTIKRFQPRAMGRATKIRKRTSHLTILLTPKD